jgi:glyoxylase-like metal-dependent hydrolase (beta-lactamase superfamily II)
MIRDGFYALNHGFVASYVLDAGESLVAFDTGLSPGILKKAMTKLGLGNKRVAAVFYTHADPDHVGGAAFFAGAKAYISKDELAIIDGEVPRHFGFLRGKGLPFPFDTLEDGQTLRVGTATIRCIATPGHTPGSMSFLVNDSILVVGDELNMKNGVAVLDRNFISMDNAERKRSFEKIKTLDNVTLLCPAHSGCATDFSKAFSLC